MNYAVETTTDAQGRIATTMKVKHLRVGMVLNSGATIESNPIEYVRTPKGKCDLVVKYSDGTRRAVRWGKETTVVVVNQNPA